MHRFNPSWPHCCAIGRSGTTADLNKYTVAYWDGHEVRGIHLHHDNGGRLGGDFDSDKHTFNQLHAHI
jgi:hypothetical protein